MVEQNLLSILALLPFLCSIILLSLPHDARRAAALISGLSLVSGLVILAGFHPDIAEGRTLRAMIEWVPAIGLNLGLRMDGFAWLFVTLVLFIGLMVVIYANSYMEGQDRMPRFFALLMAFTGAMQGILLSGNILILVVFWELTSVISFLLIGFWHQSAAARDGARTALIITAMGGLCLLAAMLIIGHITGGYSLDHVLASGDTIRGHHLYDVALILFLLGAFTKSAQFPFHFWLPGAMAAPTPVSAYLHSATMVKAGVFLLIRFSPALGGTPEWFVIVTGAGILTMLIGGLIAIYRHDLKGLLAYSTISHLGLITALAGIGGPAAILAAIFHLCNHALFKAALFMSAGIIDHETGTRDLRKLSGLMRLMPVTGALSIAAAAAMAGLPPMNGFISKEMFLETTLHAPYAMWLSRALPYLAVVAATLSVAYTARFVLATFFGPQPTDLPETPHEPPNAMRGPVAVLVGLCLAIGLFPGVTIEPALNIAAQSVSGGTSDAHLALWHGVNAALLLSIIAVVVGLAIYLTSARGLPAGPEGPPLLHHLRAQKAYDWLQLQLGWRWPRVAQNFLGKEGLQPQLRLLVLFALVACGGALYGTLQLASGDEIRLHDPSPAFALMWVAGGFCAIGAAWQAKYHRFAALVLLGGAGLITCLTFAWLSAPDLAVTQLLVEVVTTVLLLLGLRWLPKRSDQIAEDRLLPAKLRRARDLVIASAGGIGVAVIAYAVMTRPLVPNIGDWFLANAYHEGGGTNVVNVILVDFRAFDTFGEICVLAIVGLTIYSLLRRFRPTAESVEAPKQQSATSGQELTDYLYVPGVIMLWMFPLLILVASYFFFRGHDLPGGGFAAGVTMAIAFLLQYLATNVRWVEARITILPIRWMGFGMLVATATGMAAWIFGYPFLTAHARYVHIPLIGDVPAASAMAFDLGIFATVMGATVLMLIAIAHQSLRASRMREHDAESTGKEPS